MHSLVNAAQDMQMRPIIVRKRLHIVDNANDTKGAVSDALKFRTVLYIWDIVLFEPSLEILLTVSPLAVCVGLRGKPEFQATGRYMV